MLNPKHQRYADRIRELIEEGKAVAKLEKASSSSFPDSIQRGDKIPLQAWLVKASNILETVFGSQSSHFRHFEKLMPRGPQHIYNAGDVYPIVGVLSGALDDLENGYLLGQELLIAGEVFDSVLERAKYLNQTGYRDSSAVLARIVLEDALKRLARAEGIDDNQKATKINDELRKANRYPLPQWRLIQAWLDIGNAAAHPGGSNQYDEQNLKGAIEGIEQFLATEFRA